MTDAFKNRSFQFWQYKVSHGELLIRSPKDKGHPRNADIMFVGIEYVELPRHLGQVRIEIPDLADTRRAAERLGRSVDVGSVFVLASGQQRFILVAAGMQIVESDMDIFQSPFA